MQETWVQFPGWENPLEKGMATHSGILAWRIPWTEKTGGYSPWGHKSQTRFSDSITTTMTEDVIVAWHHQLNGHKSEQTPGDRERKGTLAAAVHGVAKSCTQISY